MYINNVIGHVLSLIENSILLKDLSLEGMTFSLSIKPTDRPHSGIQHISPTRRVWETLGAIRTQPRSEGHLIFFGHLLTGEGLALIYSVYHHVSHALTCSRPHTSLPMQTIVFNKCRDEGFS